MPRPYASTQQQQQLHASTLVCDGAPIPCNICLLMRCRRLLGPTVPEVGSAWHLRVPSMLQTLYVMGREWSNRSLTDGWRRLQGLQLQDPRSTPRLNGTRHSSSSHLNKLLPLYVTGVSGFCRLELMRRRRLPVIKVKEVRSTRQPNFSSNNLSTTISNFSSNFINTNVSSLDISLSVNSSNSHRGSHTFNSSNLNNSD